MLGQNTQNFTFNRESIRQASRDHRKKMPDEIRTSFVMTILLTIHWNGMMLPDLTLKNKVNRLSVIVSRNGNMKLLGVSKIQNGLGEVPATAGFEAL